MLGAAKRGGYAKGGLCWLLSEVLGCFAEDTVANRDLARCFNVARSRWAGVGSTTFRRLFPNIREAVSVALRIEAKHSIYFYSEVEQFKSA